ncbi:MAG: hypothetical protein N3A54_00185 [Patescibacteria group bacterium]|nr:hypothetical protein [Patescibacteria group bacterium]
MKEENSKDRNKLLKFLIKKLNEKGIKDKAKKEVFDFLKNAINEKIIEKGNKEDASRKERLKKNLGKIIYDFIANVEEKKAPKDAFFEAVLNQIRKEPPKEKQKQQEEEKFDKFAKFGDLFNIVKKRVYNKKAQRDKTGWSGVERKLFGKPISESFTSLLSRIEKLVKECESLLVDAALNNEKLMLATLALIRTDLKSLYSEVNKYGLELEKRKAIESFLQKVILGNISTQDPLAFMIDLGGNIYRMILRKKIESYGKATAERIKEIKKILDDYEKTLKEYRIHIEKKKRKKQQQKQKEQQKKRRGRGSEGGGEAGKGGGGEPPPSPPKPPSSPPPKPPSSAPPPPKPPSSPKELTSGAGIKFPPIPPFSGPDKLKVGGGSPGNPPLLGGGAAEIPFLFEKKTPEAAEIIRKDQLENEIRKFESAISPVQKSIETFYGPEKVPAAPEIPSIAPPETPEENALAPVPKLLLPAKEELMEERGIQKYVDRLEKEIQEIKASNKGFNIKQTYTISPEIEEIAPLKRKDEEIEKIEELNDKVIEKLENIEKNTEKIEKSNEYLKKISEDIKDIEAEDKRHNKFIEDTEKDKEYEKRDIIDEYTSTEAAKPKGRRVPLISVITDIGDATIPPVGVGGIGGEGATETLRLTGRAGTITKPVEPPQEEGGVSKTGMIGAALGAAGVLFGKKLFKRFPTKVGKVANVLAYANKIPGLGKLGKFGKFAKILGEAGEKVKGYAAAQEALGTQAGAGAGGILGKIGGFFGFGGGGGAGAGGAGAAAQGGGFLGKIAGALKLSPKVTGALGKVGNVASKVGKKLPGLLGSGIYLASQMFDDTKPIGERISRGLVGLGGTALGAKIGGSLGAIAGSFIAPGVGTAIGGALGAALGSSLGAFLGEAGGGKLYDMIFGKSETAEPGTRRSPWQERKSGPSRVNVDTTRREISKALENVTIKPNTQLKSLEEVLGKELAVNAAKVAATEGGMTSEGNLRTDAINRSSLAAGMFQFLPRVAVETAKNLEDENKELKKKFEPFIKELEKEGKLSQKSKEEVAKLVASLSEKEQATLYKKYIEPLAIVRGGYENLTAEELKSYGLAPSSETSDSDDDTIVYRKGTPAYDQNTYLDLNKDGVITKGEIREYSKRAVQRREVAFNRFMGRNAEGYVPAAAAAEPPVTARAAAPPPAPAGVERPLPVIMAANRIIRPETAELARESMTRTETATGPAPTQIINVDQRTVTAPRGNANERPQIVTVRNTDNTVQKALEKTYFI